MKKLCLLTFLSLVLCVSCAKKETDPEVIAMRGLVNRVVPEYSKSIILGLGKALHHHGPIEGGIKHVFLQVEMFQRLLAELA